MAKNKQGVFFVYRTPNDSRKHPHRFYVCYMFNLTESHTSESNVLTNIHYSHLSVFGFIYILPNYIICLHDEMHHKTYVFIRFIALIYNFNKCVYQQKLRFVQYLMICLNVYDILLLNINKLNTNWEMYIKIAISFCRFSNFTGHWYHRFLNIRTMQPRKLLGRFMRCRTSWEPSAHLG